MRTGQFSNEFLAKRDDNLFTGHIGKRLEIFSAMRTGQFGGEFLAKRGDN